MNATRITACRSCGSADLTELFSLGEQVVSDFVDTAEGNYAECPKCKGRGGWETGPNSGECPNCCNGHVVVDPPRVPIELVLCRGCTLVQQRFTAPSDLLYRRHYWYRSGTTDTMRRALADVVDAAMDRVRLEPGDVVLDIGSNDGTLLRQYPKDLNLTRIGVEPATNLTTQDNYENRGIGCVRDFWGSEATENTAPTKIITACGMLYDLDNPNTFIQHVAKAMHPDGVFVAQLQCLAQTVRLGDVGNYCHEHLEFYSLRSLADLFWRNGLAITDVEENNVNGGSYRVYALKRTKDMSTPFWGKVSQFIAAEQDHGLAWDDNLRAHFREMVRNGITVRQFINRVVDEGKRVWVYGASTKGNVIAQFLGLTPELIVAAADRSPEKVGRVMAGSGILILSEDDFRRATPDHALVMPYTFLPEFVQREQGWLSYGNKFIVPIPVPGLVGVDGKVVPL